MTRGKKLVALGWRKRSTHDEPRLSEMAAAYEDIGLEVHIEPFDPGGENGCTDCMCDSPGGHGTIYTRRKTDTDR